METTPSRRVRPESPFRVSGRLAGAVTALALVAFPARADITIGLVGPMTGTFDVFGAEMRAGAAQAVADINAQGGVLGEMLVLDIADDACDPQKAVAIANQMAGKGVPLVVGHLCSAASIQAAPVYAEAKVVAISPGSGNPKLTDARAGPGIFRIAARDDRQGVVAGAYLAREFAGEDVAIVDDGSNYGKGLATAARDAMNAAGKKETLSDSYDPDERDFGALADKLRAAGIDVVYVGGYHTAAALLARALNDLGQRTIVFSGDALMTDEYWSIAGEAAEGTLLTYPPDPRKDPSVRKLVETFRDREIEPEGYVLPTYAAVQIWAEAAKAAGATDFASVTAELAKSSFATAIGDVRFDEKGDITRPGYAIWRWHDGRADPVRP